MEDKHGLIFDIQGFSVHDGPGSRTTVFFKGCPLECQWCANPESWKKRKEIMWRRFNCKNCLRCVEACDSSAISFGENGISIQSDKCSHCSHHKCVSNCFYDALHLVGEDYSPESLLETLNRQRDSWGAEGGVTFSGGEPLMHYDFLSSILDLCCENYIHTAIETTALCETEKFMAIMDKIDFAFIDIKHMNASSHASKTGVKNELILENISKLARSNWDGRLIIRTPIIENFNDSRENLEAQANFMVDNGLTEVNLLPFHRMGESKWNGIGKAYPFGSYENTSMEKLEELKSIFSDKGINCYLGSDTPF